MLIILKIPVNNIKLLLILSQYKVRLCWVGYFDWFRRIVWCRLGGSRILRGFAGLFVTVGWVGFGVGCFLMRWFYYIHPVNTSRLYRYFVIVIGFIALYSQKKIYHLFYCLFIGNSSLSTITITYLVFSEFKGIIKFCSSFQLIISRIRLISYCL